MAMLALVVLSAASPLYLTHVLQVGVSHSGYGITHKAGAEPSDPADPIGESSSGRHCPVCVLGDMASGLLKPAAAALQGPVFYFLAIFNMPPGADVPGERRVFAQPRAPPVPA